MKQAKKKSQPYPSRGSHPEAAASRFPSHPAGEDVLIGGLLLIAMVAAYRPAINGALVWDDAAHVTAPALRSLHGLYRIWFEFGATQQYYPLLHSAFWFEHRLWGDAVLGYHLVTLTLHAVAAFLLVALMRRLQLPGAWLAAGIFALHPVCTEAVAWISEQKDTLSLVLYLSSALCYLRFDRERSKRLYSLALVLYGMALLAKSVTATLPIALLVVLWWERGRLELKRDVLPVVPWVALGISAGALTAWVEKTYVGAHGADFNLSIIDRCLLAGRILWFYIAKIVWPSDLMFVYPRWSLRADEPWQYLFPIAALAVALGFWIYSIRTPTTLGRAPLAAFLCFAVTLAPALGFVNVYPFLFSYVADHFQYHATLAVIIPFAAAITIASKRLLLSISGLVPAAATVLLAILGFLTWHQSGMYIDEATLYRRTIAQNPGAWLAYLNLAMIVDKAPGNQPEAIRLTQKALQLKPDSALAMNNMGKFLSEDGQLVEGLVAYRKAVQLAPEMEAAHVGLAHALVATHEKPDEAVAEYRTAIHLRPDDEGAHSSLGNLLMSMPGRVQEAMAEYRAAAGLNSDSAGAHWDLAEVWEQAGNENEAIAEYREVLRARPNYAEAHLNLGTALAKTPNGAAAAIGEYRAAIRFRPHYAQAHFDLGVLLADMPGREADGIAEYEEAVREQPDYVEAQYNLGVALLDVPGRTDEAFDHFRAALGSNPKLAEAQYAWGMALIDIPGKRPEGIEHLKAAAIANPSFEPARQSLARLGIHH